MTQIEHRKCRFMYRIPRNMNTMFLSPSCYLKKKKHPTFVSRFCSRILFPYKTQGVLFALLFVQPLKEFSTAIFSLSYYSCMKKQEKIFINSNNHDNERNTHKISATCWIMKMIFKETLLFVWIDVWTVFEMNNICFKNFNGHLKHSLNHFIINEYEKQKNN